MARPKKQPVHPNEPVLFSDYGQSCEEFFPELPDSVDLLQEIIAALLTRIRRKSEQEANQLVVILHAITARAEYFKKNPEKPRYPTDTMMRIRERDAYFNLLLEIAFRRTTRSSHCKETIVDQGMLLDRYLGDHPDFLKLRNAVMRMEWITNHAPAINYLLTPLSCFCSYYEKMLDKKWDERGLRDVLIEPSWMKEFTKRPLYPAKLRDAFLAMLHGVTPIEIVQIRKKPGLLVTEGTLPDALDSEWLWFGMTGIKPRIPFPE